MKYIIISRIISLVFLLGTIVLLLLILISGVNSSGLKGLYWLQANSPPTRWTYNSLCGVNNNKNANCGSSTAGVAISPADNFNTSEPVFKQRRNHFYYLSKFGYAFHIIALFWTLVSVALLIFAPNLVALSAISALVFVLMASSLITVAAVEVRNQYHQLDRPAHLGVKLLAFTWSCVALLFLVFVEAILLLLRRPKKPTLPIKLIQPAQVESTQVESAIPQSAASRPLTSISRNRYSLRDQPKRNSSSTNSNRHSYPAYGNSSAQRRQADRARRHTHKPYYGFDTSSYSNMIIPQNQKHLTSQQMEHKMQQTGAADTASSFSHVNATRDIASSTEGSEPSVVPKFLGTEEFRDQGNVVMSGSNVAMVQRSLRSTFVAPKKSGYQSSRDWVGRPS